ncbi:hypothetical protein RRG08_016993 [Elysia crispata]|uniref:Uncharacterized protein n=1 Tax=Elysia crispata TaxID=231223 RepID=A0AAE0XYV8_9GAST|nr:hypothetical protein RRG08_016993 [Elysia crispata]
MQIQSDREAKLDRLTWMVRYGVNVVGWTEFGEERGRGGEEKLRDNGFEKGGVEEIAADNIKRDKYKCNPLRSQWSGSQARNPGETCLFRSIDWRFGTQETLSFATVEPFQHAVECSSFLSTEMVLDSRIRPTATKQTGTSCMSVQHARADLLRPGTAMQLYQDLKA